MQFVEDVFEVAAHSIDAQLELVRDQLVRVTLGQEHQDLLFAHRQLHRFIPRGRFPPERLNHTAGYLAGHGRASVEHIQKGGAQIGRLGALQQIPIRTGLKSEKHQFLIVHGGQDDDLSFRQELLQSDGAFDAGHPRQKNIHEDHVRHLLRDGPDGFLAGAARANAFEIGKRVDQLRPDLAHLRLILNERDANGWLVNGS